MRFHRGAVGAMARFCVAVARLRSKCAGGLAVVACLLGGALAGPLQTLPGDSELSALDRDLLQGSRGGRELPCRMHVSKPVLGFDFLFHVAFEAEVSNKDLADGERIRLVARLRSKANTEHSSSMVRTIPLRELQPRYRTAFRGFMLLGEGEYRIDWFLRDVKGRICSDHSEFRTHLSRGDRAVQVRMSPNTGHIVGTQWKNQWNAGEERGSLRLKLLLNVPPFKEPERRLWPGDVSRFFHIVEALALDPRVGRMDIVAFNLKDRRVLFRRDNVSGLQFPEFHNALRTLNSDQIDLESLREGSDTRFLAKLVRDEVAKAASGCDAVVFVGPRADLDHEVPDEVLEGVGSGPPVHYLRFRYTEYGANWKDSISRVVDAGNGHDFSILHPRDLWKAVHRLLGELDGRVTD